MYRVRLAFIAPLALAALLAAPLAYAHDGEEDGALLSADIDVRADVKVESRDQVRALFETTKAEIERMREEARRALETKRTEVKTNVELRVDGRVEISDARRAEIKIRIEERHDAFAEKADERERMREEHRREIADTLETRAASRVNLHLDRFTTILDAAIDRMYGLIARVSARADAMDAEGKNTAAAREFLDLATSELVAAEADLASADADIEASLSADANLSAEALRELFAGTKEVIASAKAHVRAAHEAIRSAVAALKVSASVSASAEMDGESGE